MELSDFESKYYPAWAGKILFIQWKFFPYWAGILTMA
jgi:hypothetical protein